MKSLWSPLLVLLSLTNIYANETYNVTSYGANLSDNEYDDQALNTCLTNAVANGGTCYIPSGVLKLSIYPQALRQSVVTESTAVKNLNGAVLRGDGPSTVIKGQSEHGFDVLQLNAVSNLTIKDLSLTASKTTDSLRHGVNGISMTNGTNNIHIENVHVYDLPFVVKSNYIDGGKAFTVQPATTLQVPSKNITVTNSTAANVPFGFGLDADTNLGAEPSNIRVTNNTFHTYVTGIYFSFVAHKRPQTVFGALLSKNVIKSGRQGIHLSRGRSYFLKDNNVEISKNLDAIQFPESTALAVLYQHQVPLRVSGVSNLSAENNTLDARLGDAHLKGDEMNANVHVFRSNTLVGCENGATTVLAPNDSFGHPFTAASTVIHLDCKTLIKAPVLPKHE